jgi:hypothetical protein
MRIHRATINLTTSLFVAGLFGANPTTSRADLLVTFSNSWEIWRLDGTSGARKPDFFSVRGLFWEYAHKGAFGPDGDFYLPGGALLQDEVLRFSGNSGLEIGRMTMGTGINVYATAFDAEQHLLVLGIAYDVGSGLPWKGYQVWVYSSFGGDLLRVVSFPNLDPNSPYDFTDMVSLPDGGIVVSDEYHGLRWSPPGGDAFAPLVQTGPSVVTNATGLALGPDGNLYVSSYATDEIYRFDAHSYTNSPSATPSFPLIDVFVPSGYGGLKGPRWLAFGPDGNLYVESDYFNGPTRVGKVLRYHNHTGAFIDVFADLDLSLSAGQFPDVSGIQFTPPAPVIQPKMTLSGLVLEWPQSWTNYVAERNTDPTDTNGWTALTGAPFLVGTNLSVTNPTSADREFFRLRRTN